MPLGCRPAQLLALDHAGGNALLPDVVLAVDRVGVRRAAGVLVDDYEPAGQPRLREQVQPVDRRAADVADAVPSRPRQDGGQQLERLGCGEQPHAAAVRRSLDERAVHGVDLDPVQHGSGRRESEPAVDPVLRDPEGRAVEARLAGVHQREIHQTAHRAAPAVGWQRRHPGDRADGYLAAAGHDHRCLEVEQRRDDLAAVVRRPRGRALEAWEQAVDILLRAVAAAGHGLGVDERRQLVRLDPSELEAHRRRFATRARLLTSSSPLPSAISSSSSPSTCWETRKSRPRSRASSSAMARSLRCSSVLKPSG